VKIAALGAATMGCVWKKSACRATALLGLRIRLTTADAAYQADQECDESRKSNVRRFDAACIKIKEQFIGIHWRYHF
jgi:hypothetical protein